MAGYTVGDLVAEFLALAGVTTAFGVVSVHNVPMLDGIGRRNAIRFVMARGELGASHMADGYARASGGLGVVITSTGPGAANAVAGLVEARFAGTALLHLTGQTATRFVDRGMGTVHDVADQLGMLRTVSKAAFRVRSPEQALGTLTRAAVCALTPPMGPVSVEVPIDIQRSPVARPAEFDHFVLPLPPPLEPDAAALDAFAARLASARRPVLWLGSGARGAGEGAQALLDLGFAAVTSGNGRGVVPEDHPMTLGALNGNGSAAVQEFYAGCDLMLAVGTRLRGHETGDFTVKLPPLVQIDVDPEARGRTYPAQLMLHGDARVSLPRLAARLAGRMRIDPAFAGDFAAAKARAQEAFRTSLGPYASFPAQLRQAMPRDARWVRDVTLNNSTWGNRLFPVYGPHDALHPIGAGIGLGLALGIGAALAPGGRKTVMMSGDGGFFLNLGELWTAVQERADMVMLVMNDGGYGVIRHIQDAFCEGRRFYGDLLGPDLQRLAALAGIPSWKVAEADRFGPVMAEAIAHRGPSLVEVDMAAIGPFPPYHPFDRKAA